MVKRKKRVLSQIEIQKISRLLLFALPSNIIKIKGKSISRVLFSDRNQIAYHLSSPNLTIGIKRPTLRDWASNPQSSVYMVFQSVRFTLQSMSPLTR